MAGEAYLTRDFWKRAYAALAAGADPREYFVSADRLREVIQGANAGSEMKAKLLEHLEGRVIQGRSDVRPVEIGYAWKQMTDQYPNNADLLAIWRDVNDLDKLPFSIVNGQRVQ